MSRKLVTWLLIIFSILGIISLAVAIIFALTTRLIIKDTVEILRGSIEILALIFGAFWVLFKLFEYREFMHWIQLDIDKNLYKLSSPVNASIYSWENGERKEMPKQLCTHVIEVVLKFTNKGKIRFKLYNIQISIFTMDTTKQVKFNEGSGYLSLTKILTSGNIVEEKLTPKPSKESSFYYIEPGVQQEITYLALIPQPQELLQVAARFNLKSVRMFPEKTRATNRDLYPHTAARTFQVDESIPN